MFSKVSQNSQENTYAGASNYQFNSQSMGRPDKCTSSQWNKKGVPKNLANLTGKHLCWSATSLKLDSNTAASLLNQ